MTNYGHLAGDALLRRLADILISVGLNAYHEYCWHRLRAQECAEA
jgi:hypothetical protein